MKKLLSILLALALVFAVMGCKDKNVDPIDPFAANYQPITEEQLTEIKTNFTGWFDETWDKYSGDAKIITQIDDYKITQNASLYMITTLGEEKMSLVSSFMGVKSEVYIKDGIQYIKVSAGSEVMEAYSLPIDYDFLLDFYEENDIEIDGDLEELIGMGNLPYNLKDVLRAVSPDDLNLENLATSETNGEIKIKATFEDMDFSIDYGDFGFEYSIFADLELYLIINKDNKLTDIKIIFNMNMDIMELGMYTVYELMLKPYDDEIILPNDLNEANYPSLFTPLSY